MQKKSHTYIVAIITMGNRSSAYEFDKLDELKQVASLNTNQLNELYSKGSILQTNIEEVQRGDEKLLEKSTKEMNSSKIRREKMESKLEEIRKRLEEIDEIDTLHDGITKVESDRKDFDTNLPIQIEEIVDAEVEPWSKDISRFKTSFEEIRNFSTMIATKGLNHDRSLRELTKTIDELTERAVTKSCQYNISMESTSMPNDDDAESSVTAASDDNDLEFSNDDLPEQNTKDEEDYFADETII